MNKDKISLEEAIKQCNKFIKAFKKDDTKSVIGFDVQAIETVLEGLKNKEKDIKNYEEMYDEDERKISNLRWKNEIYVKSIKSYKESLDNSIPKKKIEEYLEEETEKYKVYKKEVDKNENLRGQLWHHMGAKNMCEKILGIEKTVTLD